MPSAHDDSPGTTRPASPRFPPPGNPAKTPRRPVPATHDRWLVDYLTRRLVDAGIDATLAAPLAADVQPDISAAFSTLARLDRVCDPFGGLNPCSR